MPRRKKLGDVQPQPNQGKGASSLPPPPAGSDQGAGDPPAGPAMGEAQVGSMELSKTPLRSYKKDLPCALTADELRQKTLDFTQTFHEIDAEEAFQKKTKDTLKGRMASLVDKQRRLFEIVESGNEERPVDVDELLVGNFVEVTRRDTGEVVTRHEPNQSDLQPPMPLEEILEQGTGDGADPKE